MANEINRIFLEAISTGGLDPTWFAEQMRLIENGLRTWLALRQLEAAHLEVWDPVTDKVRTRLDLNIQFRAGQDERYHTDIERVRGELTRIGSFDGCQYRIVVTLAPGAVDVKGWGPTAMRSVDHLTRHEVGEVIDTGRAGAQMFTWS